MRSADELALHRILYEPVLLIRERGSVSLEVHPDVYRRVPDPLKIITERARAEGFLEMLDLTVVQEVVSKREGIARNVARH